MFQGQPSYNSLYLKYIDSIGKLREVRRGQSFSAKYILTRLSVRGIFVLIKNRNKFLLILYSKYNLTFNQHPIKHQNSLPTIIFIIEIKLANIGVKNLNKKDII